MNYCLLGAGALAVEKLVLLPLRFLETCCKSLWPGLSDCHRLSLPPSHCCHHGYMLLGVAFPPPPWAMLSGCLFPPLFLWSKLSWVFSNKWFYLIFKKMCSSSLICTFYMFPLSGRKGFIIF